MDSTFDALHAQERLRWTTENTPFSYPVFVVWKTVNAERKGRVVVDIRGLNQLVVPDAYPLPLQADIIAAVKGSSYISVVALTVARLHDCGSGILIRCGTGLLVSTDSLLPLLFVRACLASIDGSPCAKLLALHFQKHKTVLRFLYLISQ